MVDNQFGWGLVEQAKVRYETGSKKFKDVERPSEIPEYRESDPD
jgi:hypothetical protein